MAGYGQNPNPGGNPPPGGNPNYYSSSSWNPAYYPPPQPPRQAPQPPYPEDGNVNSLPAQMMEPLDRRQQGYQQPVQQVTGVPPTSLGYATFPPSAGRGSGAASRGGRGSTHHPRGHGQAPGSSASAVQPQAPPRTHKPWTPAQREQLVKWRDAKIGWKDIARMSGRTEAACKVEHGKSTKGQGQGR